MKVEQQTDNMCRPGKKYRILAPAFMPIFVTIFLLITTLKNAEAGNVTSKLSSSDSLTLIYNNINAANFPRIVSLVSVMNKAGVVIPKLDENNFIVHEDNTRELPIDVVELTNDTTGINVVLVIDKSGSMIGQPIEDEKAAASIFVGLMHSNDRSAIVSFNRKPTTDCTFTSDKNVLLAAISGLISVENSGTAIFDALIHTANLIKLDLANLHNRAIILMSDGEDLHSQHTYEEALAELLPLEVLVFTIGLSLDRNSEEEQVLIDLANATGGNYYYSPTSSDLAEIYMAISKLLHHRYQVSYTTHNPAKDGTLRHVRIDVMVNTSTSWDTASYRAPYEPDPGDTLDPVDPEPVEPPFEIVPNPFTPNDDGYNDWAEFKKGDSFPQDWNVSIMDRSGRLIRYLNNGENIWNGKDKSGNMMLPGFYLYVVSNGNHVIHRGLIQLIR